MKKGIFTSVWDGGNEVTTIAELDEETGRVIAESVDVDDLDLEYLDKEYFTDVDGNEYTVCPDCHEFVMREKCIEGEGNGIDYDGQLICSDPYCESNLVDARVKLSREVIVQALKSWIDEADHKTIVRVFNSEFEGNLTYDVGGYVYELDSDSVENLGIGTW